MRKEQDITEFKHKANMSSWINGIYFANAIASVMSKKAKYPEKPIDFWEEENKEIKTEAEKEAIIKNAMLHFEEAFDRINETRKRKG